MNYLFLLTFFCCLYSVENLKFNEEAGLLRYLDKVRYRGNPLDNKLICKISGGSKFKVESISASYFSGQYSSSVINLSELAHKVGFYDMPHSHSVLCIIKLKK
jgi:hypothetical protein